MKTSLFRMSCILKIFPVTSKGEWMVRVFVAGFGEIETERFLIEIVVLLGVFKKKVPADKHRQAPKLKLI